MPLRRLPGPPDLERVVAVLGDPPPGRTPAGWVPDEPPTRGQADAGDHDASLGRGRVGHAESGDAGGGAFLALPDGRDPRGWTAGEPTGAGIVSDGDTARLDAQLRVARRPGLFTVPEQLRTGRVAVSSAAVVAVLALVVAVGCALALRVLWAERSANEVREPSTGSGKVSVEPAVRAAASGSTAAPSAAAAPSASATASARLVVHVVGEVKRPGLVRLAPGSRVADAIAAAGGATSRADLSLLNLARLVVDGEQIHVPRPGEVVAGGVSSGAPGASGSGGGVGGAAAGAVNLNTADLATLDTLPGVGPVLAQRILDWRSEHGRFTSVEELGEVSGIGDKLYAQLRPKVTV